MSTKIAKRKRQGELAIYEPHRHRLNVAALDYGIKEAKLIKNWPALEEAIDLKIEEQQKFVAWWKGNVGAGKGQKGKRRDLGVLPEGEAERLTGMKHQRVSDLGKWLKKLEKYRLELLGVEYRAAMLAAADNVRGTGGTGENEWFTPVEYLDRAREVLGTIDLDPATHEDAQRTVQAAKYFTKADNGLAHEWHGRVWLNPPYAQPHIADFVNKMIAERCANRVTAAIMLTHNYTDTGWFQSAVPVAAAICFTSGRIRFIDLDGGLAAPTQGQAFFYFGNDVELFARQFADIGFVALPWRKPA